MQDVASSTVSLVCILVCADLFYILHVTAGLITCFTFIYNLIFVFFMRKNGIFSMKPGSCARSKVDNSKDREKVTN